MTTIPTIIGVDPGEKMAGVALYVDGRLTGSAHLKDPDQIDCIETLQALCKHANLPDPKVEHPINELWVEDWTHPRGDKAKKSLAAAQRMWIKAGERLGILVQKVNSQTWQGALGIGGTMESKVRKIMSKHIAGQELFKDPDSIDENEADAICIARWRVDQWCYQNHPRMEWTGEEVG